MVDGSRQGQGWKLRTVRLSGTGENCGGHVNIFGTFPKESLKFCLFQLVYISGLVKNNGGQADLFNTFPRERQIFSVISTPEGFFCFVGGKKIKIKMCLPNTVGQKKLFRCCMSEEKKIVPKKIL